MNKPLSWFEIPALDLKRAEAFYETVLGLKLLDAQVGDTMNAIFPYDQDNLAVTGGALVAAGEAQSAPGGTIVYLHAEPIDEVVARVERAGGKILLPKMQLPADIGFIAHIADTEGNRVGLHGKS